MNIQSRYWNMGKEDTLWGRVVVPDKSEQEMTGRDLSRMIE